MVDQNKLPAGTVKWSGDELQAEEDVSEFKVEWSSHGMKVVTLKIASTTITLHFNVPDTGTLNRDDNALLQQIGILCYGTIGINGVAAINRVEAKYGTTASTGGTRQDAIRHSTWNAISAQACGAAFTRAFTTANERTGQYQQVALASNTTMDLHNNSVGIEAGELLFGTNTPMEVDDWIERMEEKFDNAELWAWTPPNNSVSSHDNILRKSDQSKIFEE